MRRSIAIGARALIFIALGLALAGMYRINTNDQLAVIALVDVSGSARTFGDFSTDSEGNPLSIDLAARSFLSDSFRNNSTNDDETDPQNVFGMIAIDGGTQTITRVSGEPRFDRSLEIEPINGSNLIQSIEFARTQIPQSTNARFVLISDGRSTDGDLGSISSDLPIDVVPIRYRVAQEVSVDWIETPSRAISNSLIDVRVLLSSIARTEGAIRLWYNNRLLDLNGSQQGTDQSVSLEPGQQVITIPVLLKDRRVHRFEAMYIPSSLGSDTSEENNLARSVTMSGGRGRIAVVAPADDEGDSDSKALVEFLGASGWEIEELNAIDLSEDLITLDEFDLIVLVNTARDMLSLGVESSLDSYVRELGGGLIFVGGPNALGAGRWQGSELEPIIPVKLDVADKLLIPPVAVVLVLDSSGSMKQSIMGSSRSQQVVANDAAAGAIDALDQRDLIGVVSFSGSVRTVVELGPNTNPDSKKSRIRSIYSGGGTNIPPAINRAAEMLDGVNASSKHIVLLSDGESENADDLPGLSESLGREGVKITTISVGDGADVETMRAIASNSGGYHYRVLNPSVLPRVFLKAIRAVHTPMIREGDIPAIFVEPNSPAITDIGGVSNLSGIVMSERIEDDPRVHTPIVSEKGEPILANLQAELGRVSVLTTDVSEWSSSWIGSGDFSKIWFQLIQWTMRSSDDEPGELALRVNQREIEIEYNAIDEQGNPLDGLDVLINVYDDQGIERSSKLIQSGPGVYTGSIDEMNDGVQVLIASPSREGNPMIPTIAGTQIQGVDEYGYLNADVSGLRLLADRTGGRVIELNELGSTDLFDRNGFETQTALFPMSPLVLLIALGLFLIELGARRVAFDRWVTQAREETIAATRRVDSQRVQQLRTQQSTTQDQRAPVGEIDRSPMRSIRKKKQVEQAKQRIPIEMDNQTISGSTESVDAPRSEDESNPLLAAKRRARERMDED